MSESLDLKTHMSRVEEQITRRALDEAGGNIPSAFEPTFASA
jgi:hypothetical protein